MLLRSASSPLLNCARAPAAAAEHHAVVSPPVSAPRQGSVLCRAMSDGDLAAQLLVPPSRGRKDGEAGGHVRVPRLSLSSSSASISVEEEDGEGEEYAEPEVAVAGAAAPLPLRRLLTSTGLDVSAAAAREAALALAEQGGGDGGKARGGTKAYGGERGGDAAGGDGDRSHAAAGEHYRQMIEADPGNPLLLVNYARFLREVEGDAAGARACLERAIVASPGDAEALSLYAGLVWETTRDAARADDYYSRAVQAAPDDCYVLGSYAGFLWDAEEDEESDVDAEPVPPPAAPFLAAAHQHPSVTAAS
ncbi:unnamed protein product [Urochloa humidicola]